MKVETIESPPGHAEIFPIFRELRSGIDDDRFDELYEDTRFRQGESRD